MSFLQVYLQKTPLSSCSFHLDSDVLPLTNIIITPDVVYDKLVHLNPSKAPGPEGWPILSFKENAQQLCIPLSILFSKSLESGLLPNSWKEAFVTPVFKKGSRSCVDNYRPISLTSPVIKIMESIVRDSILDHVTVNRLLSPTQHGFTVGKSCITQLYLPLPITGLHHLKLVFPLIYFTLISLKLLTRYLTVDCL